jgi:predicted RNA-binding protein with PUA-like domain
MALWLFKEEPDHYNFSDLEKDGKAVWDGVENALARLHLAKVRKGDRIWYYHTGKEKAIVGEMKALDDAFVKPASQDPKAFVVTVEPTRRLKKPVTLKQIKGDKTLAQWELVRLSRLSVMPVTLQQWQRVEAMSEEKD